MFRRKVIFISEQPLDLNSRYLKCKSELEKSGLIVHTLIINFNGDERNSDYIYISRPNWTKNKLGSTISYRFLKNKVKKFFRQNKYDVYHAMDYISLDIASLMKKYNGGKILFDACEIFTDTSFTSDNLKKYVEKVFNRSSSFIDEIITPSQHLKSHYAKKFPSWPIAEIITNAPMHENKKDYDGRLHKALGLKLNNKILLFHGAFSKLRGLEVLIDTAHTLQKGYTICFMGYGVLEKQLKLKAERINWLHGRKAIQFLKPVPHQELLKWVSGAYYGIIPYEPGPLNHQYCTPNKLYEYPASKVPVIATNMPGMAKIINEFRIGCVIDAPINIEKINKWLQANGKENHRKYVEGCINMSISKIWKKDAHQLIKTYKRMLK